MKQNEEDGGGGNETLSSDLRALCAPVCQDAAQVSSGSCAHCPATIANTSYTDQMTWELGRKQYKQTKTYGLECNTAFGRMV